MDEHLRAAWTQIVTADDYEQHMAAVGQAQAGAALTQYLVQSAQLPAGARIVIIGAGTGQMLDFLDPALLRPFQIVCTDLNPDFLHRLKQRLAAHAIEATVIQDDIEQTTLEPGADLLLATLLLEQIDWRRGVNILAALRPAHCGIISQENPRDMASVLTPGRRVPASLAKAMESAHPVLIPHADLVSEFEATGYRAGAIRAEDVADNKRLIATLFTRGSSRI